MGQAIAMAVIQQLISKAIDEIGPDDEKEKKDREPIRFVQPQPQQLFPKAGGPGGASPIPGTSSFSPQGPGGFAPPTKPDIPITGGNMEKANAFLQSPLGDLTTGTLGAIPGAIQGAQARKDRKESEKERREREERRDRIRQGQGNVQSLLAVAAALNGLLRPGGGGGF